MFSGRHSTARGCTATLTWDPRNLSSTPTRQTPTHAHCAPQHPPVRLMRAKLRPSPPPPRAPRARQPPTHPPTLRASRNKTRGSSGTMAVQKSISPLLGEGSICPTVLHGLPPCGR